MKASLPPNNWTLAKLLGKHPSCPFNPLIANAFFRAGYIESWGRGIEKIQRDCREHGIELPVYDFGMAGLMLTFRANPAQFQAALEQSPEATPQVTPQATPQVERLLAVLHGVMGRDELQAALDLRDRKSFRQLYLQPALEAGLIHMAIPDRPNSRLQRYHLTLAGEAYLAAHQQERPARRTSAPSASTARAS